MLSVNEVVCARDDFHGDRRLIRSSDLSAPAAPDQCASKVEPTTYAFVVRDEDDDCGRSAGSGGKSNSLSRTLARHQIVSSQRMILRMYGLTKNPVNERQQRLLSPWSPSHRLPLHPLRSLLPRTHRSVHLQGLIFI